MCRFACSGKESWESLLQLIRNEGHVDEVFALLIQDAVVRDEKGWDWQTQGYGQLITQMVAVSE